MKQHQRHTIMAAAAVATSLSLSLTACGGDDAPAAEAVAEAPVVGAAGDTAPSYGLVSPAQAAALAATEGITIIDVRTPEEYAEGHLDGATLIDFYDPGFGERIAALDPDGEYLVYCRSGNRSGQAVAAMAELGIDQVYDMDGGVVAYSAAGFALVR